MASYPPQIIQQPLQQPFNIMQNPIINAYASAMLKKKFGDMEDASKEKKTQEKYNKALAFAKASGKDIEYSFDQNGPSFKTATEKEPTINDMNMAYMGAASPKMYDTLSKRMGVKREALPPEETPGAEMSMLSGGLGNREEQPVAQVLENPKDAVIRALKGNPALKAVQQEQKARQSTIPASLSQELLDAAESANGDEDTLLNSLVELRIKYSDNDKAFKELSTMISEQLRNKKKSGSSESSVSKLRQVS